MEKIWNAQNNEPMYVFSESALQKRIQAKRNKAGRISTINEVGLTLIALATGTTLLVRNPDSIFSYISAIALLGVAVYVLWGRTQRLNRLKKFDQTMLGNIDQAISNVENEVRRSRTFIYWFILPTIIPSLANMMQKEVEPWQWLILPAAVVLSLIVVQYGLKKSHLPKKRGLEILREKILEEVGPS